MNDFLKLCEGELGALLVKIKNRWGCLMSSLRPHSLPRPEKGNLLSQLTESKPSPRVFTGLFWLPQIISSRAGRQRLSEAWTSSPHVAHEGRGSGDWSWAAALGMRSLEGGSQCSAVVSHDMNCQRLALLRCHHFFGWAEQ